MIVSEGIGMIGVGVVSTFGLRVWSMMVLVTKVSMYPFKTYVKLQKITNIYFKTKVLLSKKKHITVLEKFPQFLLQKKI